MKKIIAKGAEAVIIKEGRKIIKKRVKKNYRLKKIDEKLRKKRTRWEAKNMGRVGEGVPKIFKIDENKKEIEMEFISGKKLSESLNNFSKKKQEEIAKKIGEIVEKIHNKNIIHGDLTTSNIIYNKEIYLIDFGLSFYSKRIEDKAVDIHLLRRALESKHFQNWGKLFKHIINNYNPKKKEEIIKRLEKVEKRGRYK
jgi:TP53 regulating kinase-like protein